MPVPEAGICGLQRDGGRGAPAGLLPPDSDRAGAAILPAVRRYPLSTREIATLTGLSDSRVRWWADHNQLPHERTAGGHRTFGIAGLLSAFALSDSRQHELQYYREIADASGETVSEKVGTLLFVLASRLEGSLSAERQEQLDRAVLGLQEVIDDGVAGPTAARP
jgi:DNA-binding transcriptional MerR regulator